MSLDDTLPTYIASAHALIIAQRQALTAAQERAAAEEVWRTRLWDRGKTAVAIMPRADCRKLEFLSVDVER